MRPQCAASPGDATGLGRCGIPWSTRCGELQPQPRGPVCPRPPACLGSFARLRRGAGTGPVGLPSFSLCSWAARGHARVTSGLLGPPLPQVRQPVVSFGRPWRARASSGGKGQPWLQESSPVLEDSLPRTARVVAAGRESGWVPGAQIIRARLERLWDASRRLSGSGWLYPGTIPTGPWERSHTPGGSGLWGPSPPVCTGPLHLPSVPPARCPLVGPINAFPSFRAVFPRGRSPGVSGQQVLLLGSACHRPNETSDLLCGHCLCLGMWILGDAPSPGEEMRAVSGARLARLSLEGSFSSVTTCSTDVTSRVTREGRFV